MSINTTVSGIVDKVFANTLSSSLTLSKAATYTSVTEVTFTPLTGAITNSESNHSVNVIEQEFSGRDVAESAGMIKEHDRKVLMKPITGIDPTDASNDRLTIGARVMQILDVKLSSMGTTDLLWTIQCR